MTTTTTIHPTANASDQTNSSGVQRGFVMPVALTLLTIFSAGTAQAVDLYWDGTTIAGDADGGTGTWDNGTTSNWDDAASAGTDSVWNNATPDSAIFGGTAGTVTLGEAITADSLQFDTTGYTVTGSTLTLSGSSTVTANEDATIGSTLAGTSGLTKEGTGTLTVEATEGSGTVLPTGTTTVNGGALEIDLSSAGGDRSFSSNPFVINGDGSSVLIFDTIAGSQRQIFTNADWTFGSSGGGTVTIDGINPIVKGMNITTTGGVMNTFGGNARLNGQGSTTNPITFDVAAGTDPSGVDLEFSGNAGNLKLVKAGEGVMSITSGANSINAGIAINAGTLELAGSGSLNAGSYSSAIAINNAGIFRLSGAGQTLSGNITGTGSLEKINGSGALTLSGNSTYNGTTTVGDGAGTDDSLLFAGSTTGFSSSSAFTVNSDAVVLLNNFSNEIGSLAGAGIVRNANSGTTAATLTTGGDDTSTIFSGIIQNGAGGALSLTKTGSGTQTMTGISNYTGATTIDAGTLQLGDGATTGSLTGTTSISNNGNLTINRSNAFDQTTDLNAQLITGTGSFTQAGSGTTSLTGANTYSGATTITAGTLQLGDGSDGNDGTIAGASIVNNANLTYNRFGTTSYGGVISGSGSVAKEGAGTQTFTGANTYTGTTTITAGTLQLGDGGATGSLSTTSAISIASGATFAINQSDTVTQGTDFSTAAISGDGGFTQSGNGTTTLNAANTYTGTTFIDGGTLVAEGDDVAATSGALGNGGNIDFGGGTLQYATGVTQDYSSRIANSASAIKVDTNGETVLWNATLATTNTGGLTKEGSGLFRIVATSNYDGATTINGGTLQIRNVTGTQGWRPGAININNGSTLQFTGTDQTILQGTGDNITFDSNGGGSMVMSKNTIWRSAHIVTTGGAQNTVSGTYFNGQGAVAGNRVIYDVADGTDAGGIDLLVSSEHRNVGGITKNGAGTLALSNGTNSMNGGTVIINAGTLEVGAAGRLQSGSYADAITMNGDAATIFRYNSSQAQTLSGVISGVGSLEKDNSSTLTLSGDNTYSGNTTVTAGILLINNTTGSGTGTGAVTVASGASLGGSGTISGATTIQSGGFLAPGNSPGILTFSGDLTLASGSFTNMEITGSTRGTDYDGIDVGGALTYGGGLTLTSNTLIGVGTYNLFDFTSESGDFSSITLSGTAYANNTFIQDGDVWDAIVDNQTYTYSQVTGNLVVATAAVPEPETFALLGGLLALTYVLGRRRRR